MQHQQGRKQMNLVERTIIKRLVSDLLQSGHLISVNDGEQFVLNQSGSYRKILSVLGTTDENHLITYAPSENSSFVQLIYGNDEDVISDYGVSLEPIIAPIYEWIEATTLR